MKQIILCILLFAALGLVGCGKSQPPGESSARLPDPTPSAIASLDTRSTHVVPPRDLECLRKLWLASVGHTDSQPDGRGPSEWREAFLAGLHTPEAAATLKSTGADKDKLRSLADELLAAAEFLKQWDKRVPELEQHRAGLLRLANDGRMPVEKRHAYAQMLRTIESQLVQGEARRQSLHRQFGDLLSLVRSDATSG